MNYIDPKNKYRFEKLDEKDQEYSGGVGILFNNEKEQKGGALTTTQHNTMKENDLVVPFSLAYRNTKTKKCNISKDEPKVIGGELFDAMFFKIVTDDESKTKYKKR